MIFEGATISSIIAGIMWNKYISVYWFFASLFSVYLSIPILSMIKEENRKEVFTYFVGVVFIANSLIPLISEMFGIAYNGSFKVAVGGGYIIYAVLGYLISKYDISKKNRYIIYILGVAGLLIHIFGTWYLSYEAGSIVKIFKEYTNVPCILYSTAIFVFFKYTDFSKLGNVFMKIIDFISQYTFPVYLMHYFVIDIFRRVYNPDITSIKYRLIFPMCVMLICIVVTWILRKIPLIKKLVP